MLQRKKNGKFGNVGNKNYLLPGRVVQTTETEEDVNVTKHTEGRRIVEIGELIRQMRDGCKLCKKELSLTTLDGETVIGLASVFSLTCKNCSHVNKVSTSKCHVVNSRNIYDVNSKAALGMLHAGMGPSQVNHFLSTLNVPPVQEKLLKRREREVGVEIEKVAKQVCKDALDEEKEENGNTNITASYDMGWQKRGRGHNSLTGHAAMIGVKTGKIIGYGTRNKRCVQCHIKNQHSDTEHDEHDCRLNWFKSSKAMEPDVALSITQEMEDNGANLTRIVGDEDASTIKHLRDNINQEICKVTDIVHSKRTLTSHLYELKKTKPEVTDGVIQHITKCYSYALTQNKGDAEGIRTNLRAVVPHCYGDHSLCQQWCRYSKDPLHYVHRGLPGGKHLQDSETRIALEKVMDIQIQNADQLAPVLTSQANESFNATVASKAPKAKHYGGSESNDFRVAAAVCQKNLGNAYVADVCRKRNMSPGTFTLKHALLCNKSRESCTKRKGEKETKLRRQQLKQNRLRVSSAQDIREGVSYQKDCGYDLANLDTDEIPPPISQPEVVPIMPTIRDGNIQDDIIIFDLETTGTGTYAEITQISAMKLEATEQVFNKYVLPNRNISTTASDITGLTVETTVQGTRILVHNGKRVPAQPITNVISELNRTHI